MGKKQQEREARIREGKKKDHTKIAITAVVIICILAGLIYLGTMSSRKNAVNGIDITIGSDGDLVIPEYAIKTGLNKVEFNGREELLIYTDGSGEYLTALDTCQQCFSEGHVTYTLNGDQLICSNCKSSVPLSSFGENSWGGCQPLSIPVEYRTDTEGNIVVPEDVLTFIDDMLKQWEDGNFTVTLADYDYQ